MVDEAKWLSCTSLASAWSMLEAVKEAASTRKTMLLAANWIRETDTNFGDRNAKDIANSIDQIADHEIEATDSPYFSNVWFNWALVTLPDEFTYQFACLLDAQRFATREQREQAEQNFESREGRLAGYVRELFSNPFRSVTFSPSWRTDTALLLARQMYDARDFSAMPILADALQDAGCDNEDILSHCQAECPHVRGCWLVDLVLEKS